MSHDIEPRPPGVASIAALDLVATTLTRLKQRRSGMPGIGVLYGPAGWEKRLRRMRWRSSRVHTM